MHPAVREALLASLYGGRRHFDNGGMAMGASPAQIGAINPYNGTAAIPDPRGDAYSVPMSAPPSAMYNPMAQQQQLARSMEIQGVRQGYADGGDVSFDPNGTGPDNYRPLDILRQPTAASSLPANWQDGDPMPASGGASGSWGPSQGMSLPSALGTMAQGVGNTVMGAVTLPGDVYSGKTDPFSDDGVQRALNLASMIPAAGMPMAEEGALGAGGGRIVSTPHSVDDVVDAGRIEPVNQTDPSKVSSLTGSMQSGGWNGRPVLAYDGAHGTMAATGSNRIAAAKAAGVDVPIMKMDDSVHYFTDEDGNTLSDVVGTGNDTSLVKFLRNAGDHRSADLAQAEVDANNDEWDRGALGAGGGRLTAYHGSPHDFDQFDMSKLGTGEGAQAYGHGLYFAQNEGVAQSYRDALSQSLSGPHIDGVPASQSGLSPMARNIAGVIADGTTDLPTFIADRTKSISKYSTDNSPAGKLNLDYAQNALAAAQELQGRDIAMKSHTGHMYEVGINADPDHFLDYDKPLSEQHPVVQNALQQAGVMNPPGTRQTPFAKTTVPTVDDRPASSIAPMTAEAAQKLRDAGIPGLKYLDAGSRGAGASSQSHNYVSFNDNNIDILRKYGLAGLTAGGAGAAGAAAMGQQVQPQAQGFARGGAVHRALAAAMYGHRHHFDDGGGAGDGSGDGSGNGDNGDNSNQGGVGGGVGGMSDTGSYGAQTGTTASNFGSGINSAAANNASASAGDLGAGSTSIGAASVGNIGSGYGAGLGVGSTVGVGGINNSAANAAGGFGASNDASSFGASAPSAGSFSGSTATQAANQGVGNYGGFGATGVSNMGMATSMSGPNASPDAFGGFGATGGYASPSAAPSNGFGATQGLNASPSAMQAAVAQGYNPSAAGTIAGMGPSTAAFGNQAGFGSFGADASSPTAQSYSGFSTNLGAQPSSYGATPTGPLGSDAYGTGIKSAESQFGNADGLGYGYSPTGLTGLQTATNFGVGSQTPSSGDAYGLGASALGAVAPGIDMSDPNSTLGTVPGVAPTTATDPSPNGALTVHANGFSTNTGDYGPTGNTSVGSLSSLGTTNGFGASLGAPATAATPGTTGATTPASAAARNAAGFAAANAATPPGGFNDPFGQSSNAPDKSPAADDSYSNQPGIAHTDPGIPTAMTSTNAMDVSTNPMSPSYTGAVPGETATVNGEYAGQLAVDQINHYGLQQAIALGQVPAGVLNATAAAMNAVPGTATSGTPGTPGTAETPAGYGAQFGLGPAGVGAIGPAAAQFGAAPAVGSAASASPGQTAGPYGGLNPNAFGAQTGMGVQGGFTDTQGQVDTSGLPGLTVHGIQNSPTMNAAGADADTNAPASGAFTMSAYNKSLQGVEDPSGDPNATNSQTQAFGIGQITPATWAGIANNNPSLGLPSTAQQATPGQYSSALNALTAEDQNALTNAGITADPVNTYAAHLLGAPVATAALSHSPDTSLADAGVPSADIANNPAIFSARNPTGIAATTVGQMQANIAALGFGQTPTSTPASLSTTSPTLGMDRMAQGFTPSVVDVSTDPDASGLMRSMANNPYSGVSGVGSMAANTAPSLSNVSAPSFGTSPAQSSVASSAPAGGMFGATPTADTPAAAPTVNVQQDPKALPGMATVAKYGMGMIGGALGGMVGGPLGGFAGGLAGSYLGGKMGTPGVNAQAIGSNNSNTGNNNIAAQQAYQNQLPGSLPAAAPAQAAAAPATQTPTPLYNNGRGTAGPGPNGTGGYRIPATYTGPNLNDRNQAQFYNPLNDPAVQQALSYGQPA